MDGFAGLLQKGQTDIQTGAHRAVNLKVDGPSIFAEPASHNYIVKWQDHWYQTSLKKKSKLQRLVGDKLWLWRQLVRRF